MSFTENSEKLIKSFVKEFENYCVKKTKTTQNRTDKILKTIFNDIRKAEQFVEISDKNKKMQINVREIKSLKEYISNNTIQNCTTNNNYKSALPKIFSKS